nr:hypothetical protein CFP56_09953 [Quercus suber]
MTGDGDVDGHPPHGFFAEEAKWAVPPFWRGTQRHHDYHHDIQHILFSRHTLGSRFDTQTIEITAKDEIISLYRAPRPVPIHQSGNMSGHDQPTLQQAYETPGNPASKEPAEKAQTQANAEDNSRPVDRRVPQEQNASVNDATPSSLGYGVRGAPPGEEAAGRTEADVSRARENDGEQMRAPGEGEIASAVDRKPGAGGEEQGLEKDLERKKAEQAPAREQVQAEQKKELDVAGVLGQRGGPANPVDKNGYPNA